MKCSIDRKVLAEALGVAAGVVPSRTPKPILQSVLLVADDLAGSSLVATDLETCIRVKVGGCRVDEPGSVLLDASRVGTALKSYPDGEVNISTRAGGVVIRSASGKIDLNTEDPALFPLPREFPAEGPTWEVDAESLIAAIDATVFAVDEKSMKYALGGCLFDGLAGSPVMVACSGPVLATMKFTATPCGVGSAPRPIVSAKLLKVASRMFDGEEGTLRFAFSGSLVGEPTTGHFAGESGEVSGPLVAGRFPRYELAWPSSVVSTCRVNADALMAAVGCAAAVLDEMTAGIDLRFAEGRVEVRSAGATIGESQSDVPAVHAGPTVDVRLHSRYFADIIRRLPKGQEALIELVDGKNPVSIRSGDAARYAINPLSKEKP